MARCKFNRSIIAEFASLAANTLAEWTAADVRSLAKRSITHTTAAGKTYGGKRNLERMARGMHSKPGRPPYSQRGRVSQIEYAQDGDKYIVGPKQFTGQAATTNFTWHVLERGGKTRAIFVMHVPRRVRKFVRRGGIDARRKKTKITRNRPRRDPRIHETISTSRPDGARGTYKYFTSRDKWETARGTKAFLRWSQSLCGQKVVFSVKIDPRPFMGPAMVREVSTKRIDARQKRLQKYLKSKGKK